MDASQVLDALRQPERLYARSDVLSAEDPVRKSPGVYGWHLSGLNHLVLVDGCHEVERR